MTDETGETLNEIGPSAVSIGKPNDPPNYRSSTLVPSIKMIKALEDSEPRGKRANDIVVDDEPSSVVPNLAEEFGTAESMGNSVPSIKPIDSRSTREIAAAYEDQLWRASRKYCKTQGVTQDEARRLLENDPDLFTTWVNY